MTYTIDSVGWFTKIGDHPVNHRDLTKELPGSAMPWTFGKPVGILWHYTDGYNGDISGSMRANKYITAQLSIGRDGAIYQYADIYTAHWHAYDASKWGIGVEHEAHPPDSNVTDLQLGVSAEVFAAIIGAVKAKFGNDIPVVHVLGCDLGHPGIKEHADGLRCSWDPKGHSDKLYGWGWPRYLNAIKAALQGGIDVTGDDIVLGWRYRQNHPKDPLPTGKSDGFEVGWHQRDLAEKAQATPAGGVPKHSHTGSVTVT